MQYKRLYDFRGFSGMDVNYARSICEYNFAWKNTKKNEYKFLFYGINSFFVNTMNKEYFLNMINEERFDIGKVLDFCGLSKDDFIDEFPYSIYTAIQYHGYLNVFGEQYSEGFQFYNLSY